ncbi:MAG: SO_0444 family Cu/Zn efflux transporter [Phycisphaerae bacterium]|nr:SO_0444 family Cu/Zn efflux transporter [Phycisphaerae bacterium]
MQWIWNILWETLSSYWAVLGEMSPYLLFGFLVAGVLSVLISAEFIERHLGGHGLGSVIKASAFGVPLPLCSCSVIPVGTSLYRHGASKGSTTAFLISTPQTGVDSIMATFSLLGLTFAIYRPIVALIGGVLGGVFVNATRPKTSAENTPDAQDEKCTHSCCSGGEKQHGLVYRILNYGFITLPRDLGMALLVGITIGAMLGVFVSKDFSVQNYVSSTPLQILLLMLLGVPVYICATASIPVAAGLILAGVSPGAAFALLVTGPATNVATLSAVWKVLGKRTCVIYLATMLVTAFVGGLILDLFLTNEAVREHMHSSWVPEWVKIVSAILLIGVILLALVTRKRNSDKKHETCED